MQWAKNYIAHLKTQGKNPHTIRSDCSKEFMNETLSTWCAKQGIDVQLTASYSPAQNGIAEQMNHTLVELAWAMLASSKLPKFLWEYAIEHAAYLCNRSYTQSVPDSTPHKKWCNDKPDVTHLREFSTPVWVKSQGQHIWCKMLPKSQRKSYVSYNDGSKSVKFYNVFTCKVINSRNYKFLSPLDETPPEEVEITPDPMHEGEAEGGMQSMGENSCAHRKNAHRSQNTSGTRELSSSPHDVHANMHSAPMDSTQKAPDDSLKRKHV